MAKILLVEDDQNIRQIYSQILTDAGFELDIAQDGEEGLKKAQEGGYDLILLDIMMPKKDGISVLKDLKDKPPLSPNKKIIMLTVLSTYESIKSALELGAEGYFVKSQLTPEQVVKQVKSYLS
ncbi:response regulator [Candidatus Gottesmanbacteria bacterium]|nr:response regulator [Candidatus Gottesmanbacteria bacterium]